MKKNQPTAAMKSAAKKGLALRDEGRFSPDMPARTWEIGKKIASGQPLADEHVADMAHFHASHDQCPKEDCEDLLWGGPAGEVWAKSTLMKNLNTGFSEDFSKLLKDKSTDLGFEIYSDINLEEPITLGEDDNGLIWAPILRSGMLATRPGPNGEKLDEPLIFVPGHSNDPTKAIGLEDIVDAFNDNAIEYVTIPTSHENNLLENTGYIKQLVIADSKKFPGEKVVLAAHEFTEPDIKGKVQRGTIPSRSSGILYDYKNTTTGKVYPVALDHTALTHKPWMGGISAYGSKSSDFSERTIISMMLSEKDITVPENKLDPPKLISQLSQEITEPPKTEKTASKGEFLADIQWGEKPSYHDIENQVERILDTFEPDFDSYPQYFVIDITDGKALVKVNYGVGQDDDAWVVPYTVDDKNVVHLSSFSQWIDVSKRWVNDTIDPKEDKEQLDKLGKGMGLSEQEKIIVDLYLSVDQAERDKAKSNNNSLPDGSYPINNVKQLHAAAVLAASKHGDYEAAKTLIRRRAKELGVDIESLPGFGKDKKTSSKLSMSQDPLIIASERRRGTHLSNQPQGGNMTLLAMSEEQMELLGLSNEAKEFQRQQNIQIEKINSELSETKNKEKKARVENRISELADEGLKEFPGLLKEIETILLSDDEDVAIKLQLSDNGHTVSIPETATQIVERIVKALPRNDKQKIAFAEQASLLQSPVNGRPDLQTKASDPDKKKTGIDMAQEWVKADPSLKDDPYIKMMLSENGKGN
jgi:hypothetical protein